MTLDELIDALEDLHDSDAKVFLIDNEVGAVEITNVRVNNSGDVLLE